MHNRLVEELLHGDPDTFSTIELAFLCGIVESYAQNARKLIRDKKKVLGPERVQDMQYRADVAARMNTKLAELLAKKGGSDEQSYSF